MTTSRAIAESNRRRWARMTPEQKERWLEKVKAGLEKSPWSSNGRRKPQAGDA